MDNYERINRELIHKGVIIDYYQDTMKIPNGTTAKWDFINHKGAAAVVAVKDDGRLLMVRQYRNALERETLEIPAGGLNPGEATDLAAARELEEETGFKTEKLEYLLSLNTTIAFCDEAIDVFLARNLIPSEQHLDPDEEIEVEEWELSDLLDLIYSGKMTDGKTVASILAYACRVNSNGR